MDIRDFRRLVVDSLINRYGMGVIEAHRAVANSYISKALDDDVDCLDHNAVEQWAEMIFKGR
jgi:hypothetical protein